MIWTHYHSRTMGMLGFIPSFLSDADPRPAKEQFNENYAHGGGWSPWSVEWSLDAKRLPPELRYPGDPVYRAVAETRLRDERIIVFQHAIVAIVQPDGTFEVARLD